MPTFMAARGLASGPLSAARPRPSHRSPSGGPRARTPRSRGRPILLAIRVPDSVKYAHGCGLDVAAWLADGLVDLISRAATSSSALGPIRGIKPRRPVAPPDSGRVGTRTAFPVEGTGPRSFPGARKPERQRGLVGTPAEGPPQLSDTRASQGRSRRSERGRLRGRRAAYLTHSRNTIGGPVRKPRQCSSPDCWRPSGDTWGGCQRMSRSPADFRASSIVASLM